MCERAQALIGGGRLADIVAMSDDQRLAIGRVWPLDGPPGYFCTGVSLAPRWVLTARHCDVGSRFEYDHPEAVRGVTATYSHPERDALLLELDAPMPADVLPLLEDPAEVSSLVGTPVNLAGYGVGADGKPARELQLLAEHIVRVDEEVIEVDGGRRTGACRGDSGGPLLVRDRHGVLRVAGILSSGSRSCTGVDHYLRADTLADWVRERGVEPATAAQGCGGVTSAGMCRRGTAIWCERGVMRTETCSEDSACGWSDRARGYRCVTPAQDSCDGIDDLGNCDGSVAVRCHRGALVQSDCGVCGGECGWSAGVGRYDCVH